ncbi:MAG: transcriptional regulator [Acidobacteriota bacterium]|nr:transcriptional regulator [Acidobacteriota bacterium]
MNALLQTELWISWASMLRSYAAAHGLNSNRFAVIEFGEDEIVVRVDAKWNRFTHEAMESSDGRKVRFALTEDGRVELDGKMDEMDFAAERTTRELMQ